MCETTDLIKKLAHEGKSKNTIARTLGISISSLKAILELMEPVVFYPGPTYTVRGFHGTIKQIIDHFQLRITERTARNRIADYRNIDDCFFVDKYGKEEEVRGFKGSILEIIKHFNLPITADRVYKRLKAGKTLDEAYFTPLNLNQSRSKPSVQQISL